MTSQKIISEYHFENIFCIFTRLWASWEKMNKRWVNFLNFTKCMFYDILDFKNWSPKSFESVFVFVCSKNGISITKLSVLVGMDHILLTQMPLMIFIIDPVLYRFCYRPQIYKNTDITDAVCAACKRVVYLNWANKMWATFSPNFDLISGAVTAALWWWTQQL